MYVNSITESYQKIVTGIVYNITPLFNVPELIHSRPYTTYERLSFDKKYCNRTKTLWDYKWNLHNAASFKYDMILSTWLRVLFFYTPVGEGAPQRRVSTPWRTMVLMWSPNLTLLFKELVRKNWRAFFKPTQQHFPALSIQLMVTWTREGWYYKRRLNADRCRNTKTLVAYVYYACAFVDRPSPKEKPCGFLFVCRNRMVSYQRVDLMSGSAASCRGASITTRR